MKRMFAFVLAIACLPAMGSAGSGDVVIPVGGLLSMDARGTVTAVTISSAVSPAVARVVEQSVRGWTFQPVVREGKPVAVSAVMQLELRAHQVDGGYRLQIERAWFYQQRRVLPGAAMTPPRYPQAALKSGIEAAVVLALRVNAQGTVVDVVPIRFAFPQGRVEKRYLLDWGPVFAGAGAAAARQWQFAPATTTDASAVDVTLIVPITFQVDACSRACDGKGTAQVAWARRFYMPQLPIPWLTGEQVPDMSNGLADGVALSLGQPLEPVDAVVGHTL